jgi:hypothetical protein
MFSRYRAPLVKTLPLVVIALSAFAILGFTGKQEAVVVLMVTVVLYVIGFGYFAGWGRRQLHVIARTSTEKFSSESVTSRMTRLNESRRETGQDEHNGVSTAAKSIAGRLDAVPVAFGEGCDVALVLAATDADSGHEAHDGTSVCPTWSENNRRVRRADLVGPTIGDRAECHDGYEDRQVAHAAREWALERRDDSRSWTRRRLKADQAFTFDGSIKKRGRA